MGYVLYGDRLGVWGSGGREEPSHSDRRTRGFQTGAYRGLQGVQDGCQVKRKLSECRGEMGEIIVEGLKDPFSQSLIQQALSAAIC